MIVNPKTLLDTHLFNYSPENVQPNSYDLRTEKVYKICGGLTLYKDGGKDLPRYQEITSHLGFFTLFPGTLYQVEAAETVSVPENMCGVSIMRSSMAKSGASGEVGLYDSGYVGSLGMTVRVSHLCRVEAGASVAQVIFFEADSAHLYQGLYQSPDWRSIQQNEK